jgi:Transcriptional antiterminator
MLDRIIDGTCAEEIQDIIDIEKTYIKMEETLDRQLKNIDGKIALKDIKKFNSTVMEALKITLSTNILIGITFHIACMIDRLKDKVIIDEIEGKKEYIEDNFNLYRIIKNACASLNTKYSIIISDDEICCLMKFFNPKA